MTVVHLSQTSLGFMTWSTLRPWPAFGLRLPRVTCMTLSGVLCKDLLRFGVGRTLRACCGKFSMPSLGEAFTTATGGAGNHAQAGTMTPGGVKERVCRKGVT